MGAAASATARHSDPREVRVPPGPLGVRFRHTPGIGPRVAEVPADYSFSLLRVGEHVLRLDGADVSSLSSAEFCDRMKACAERSRVLRVLPPRTGKQDGMATRFGDADDAGGCEAKASGVVECASEPDPLEDSFSSVTQFEDHPSFSKPDLLKDSDVNLLI